MTDLLAYTFTGLCAYFAVALPIAVLLGRMIRNDRRMFTREAGAQALPVYNMDRSRSLAFEQRDNGPITTAQAARAVVMAR